MKRITTLFTVFLAATLMISAPMVEAKKFGGSKSFGKSFKTAPAPSKSQPGSGLFGNSQNAQKSTTTQNAQKSSQQSAQGTQQKSSNRGLWGGLLGGMLAGGLLASLFGGGAFNGLQIMDFLIIGLLAFGLFVLFRNMKRRTAYAGDGASNHFGSTMGSSMDNRYSSTLDAGFDTERLAGGSSAPVSAMGQGFADSEVPMNLPPGFDLTAFLKGAREHYRTLQKAWNRNDQNVLREYLAPELFEQLVRERQSFAGDQHTEVMYVDADLVRADTLPGKAQISISFTGRYRDTVEGVEEDLHDIWHLERDLNQPNAPWLIVGIEG